MSEKGDSDVEEEENAIIANKERGNLKLKISFAVLYPDSPLRAIWDISLFLTIVYQAIVMPMRIAFEF
jgi:hypothetical protein